MIPYFVFIVLILIFYVKKKPLVLFFILVIFCAVRYNTGWDYDSYYQISYNPTNLNQAINRYSFLWGYLFQFCYENQIPHFGIVLPEIITYVNVYVGLKILYKNDKKQMCDSFFVYSFWPFFYLGSWSTLRQALAMSLGFLLYVLLYIYRTEKEQMNIKKKLSFLLISFFGVYLVYLIHPSGIVISVLIPLCLFVEEFSTFKIFLSSIMILLGTLSMGYIVSLLESNSSSYSMYLNKSDSYGGKLVYVLGLLAFGFTFCMVKYKEIKKTCNFEIGLVIVSVIGNILMFSFGFSVVTRIFDYFAIFMILIYVKCFEQMHLKKLGMSLLVMLFVYYLYNSKNASAILECGFVPYQFIFDR